MLRSLVLSASRSDRVQHLVETAPVARSLVARFVPGTEVADAVRATGELAAEGLRVSIDHLGEDTTDASQAEAARDAYLTLLDRLQDAGLAEGADLSVKLTAIGLALPGVGQKVATEHARQLAEIAAERGATVTIDMEDSAVTDVTLEVLREVREQVPSVGAVLQAYLYRTESDARLLASAGSRVRLCKGAYKEPAAVAFQSRREVDKSYVRCLKVLMSGDGYPMVATHDPRLVDIAGALAVRAGRAAGSYEFQMLHGVRPEEQRRLARAGETVRVYLPYGAQWYGYLMRRLAERPANMMFFARAALTKG